MISIDKPLILVKEVKCLNCDQDNLKANFFEIPYKIIINYYDNREQSESYN